MAGEINRLVKPARFGAPPIVGYEPTPSDGTTYYPTPGGGSAPVPPPQYLTPKQEFFDILSYLNIPVAAGLNFVGADGYMYVYDGIKWVPTQFLGLNLVQ